MCREWNGSKWIRKEKRLAIYARDNFTCAFCGKHMVFDNVTLSLDHVQPVANGGQNDATNLITSCRLCNSKKGDRNLVSFVGKNKASMIERQTEKQINVSQAKKFINVLGYGQALKVLATKGA